MYPWSLRICALAFVKYYWPSFKRHWMIEYGLCTVLSLTKKHRKSWGGCKSWEPVIRKDVLELLVYTMTGWWIDGLIVSRLIWHESSTRTSVLRWLSERAQQTITKKLEYNAEHTGHMHGAKRRLFYHPSFLNAFWGLVRSININHDDRTAYATPYTQALDTAVADHLHLGVCNWTSFLLHKSILTWRGKPENGCWWQPMEG
jgi:hypothetical protein